MPARSDCTLLSSLHLIRILSVFFLFLSYEKHIAVRYGDDNLERGDLELCYQQEARSVRVTLQVAVNPNPRRGLVWNHPAPNPCNAHRQSAFNLHP